MGCLYGGGCIPFLGHCQRPDHLGIGEVRSLIAGPYKRILGDQKESFISIAPVVGPVVM